MAIVKTTMPFFLRKKKEPVQDRVSQKVTLSFRIKIQLLYTVAQKDDFVMAPKTAQLSSKMKTKAKKKKKRLHDVCPLNLSSNGFVVLKPQNLGFAKV